MTNNKLIRKQQSYYYIYQINFSDGTYYIGSRKSKVPPEDDINYWGSPITHKNKWNDSSLIKTKSIIKSGFKSFKTMRLFESNLIKAAWEMDKNNNLNENCGGWMSIESCRVGGKHSALLIQFVDPNGNVYVYRGIVEFCRNNDLHPSHITAVLKGKSAHHKGWTAKYLNSDGTEFINVNVKSINAEKEKKLVEFTDPSGNIYIHRGINEFCRNNNLTASDIIGVLKGRCAHHKGWKAKYLDSTGREFGTEFAH